MFRSARWRGEKNKIKAVFRLQFHATQVKQVGIDSLIVSVIPAETGKPTKKLEKAIVRDGSCYWENPVYETVKFDREAKSGKILERIYRFVVATGSSKSGVVGEASIDFCSYAEATKMSSVSLPLKNSKSEILLHVSIQRLQDSPDQREIEETETPKGNVQDRSLRAQLSNGDIEESFITNSMEDGTFNKTILQGEDLGRNHRSSSGSDVTLSSSDSSSGLDTPRELQLKNGDPTNLLSSLNHDSGPGRPSNGVSATTRDEHTGPKWGWLGGLALEGTTDDSSSTPSEALQKTTSPEASEVEKLKSELAALARQAEVSELELQTLRKQIVKESKRGQDLSREVITLKNERDSLREDFENLKSSQKHFDKPKTKGMLQLEGGDLQALIEELRQELNYEKDLNANLRIQLQKTQESNSELILAVRDLDEMLEQRNKEIVHVPSKSASDDDAEKGRKTESKCETDDDDEEQKALEQLVKEHSDAKEMYLMEQKIMDLRSEIEIYRREKDELEVQMEQLALDYEILKQENHDMSYKLEQSQLQERLKVQYECTSSYATVNELEAQIEKLEKELKMRERENTESWTTINELESHIKDLKEELEKQAEGFEADLEALTHAKVEQEQRAIRAEETLRKTRWQNANTAERLQEEFRRLSLQMASTFETNEKLATKALMEANELRLQRANLEDMLGKANEEIESLKDHYEARIHELSSQVMSLSEQIEQMESEIEEKSMKLEDQEKHAEKSHSILSQEILMLKADIEALSRDYKSLSEEAYRKEKLTVELQCSMQKSMKEMEMLIEQRNKERSELESRIAIMKKEVEQTQMELHHERCSKGEKESKLANLQAEVVNLKAQYDELTHSLYEVELEKEKLRREVIQLKGDMGKREDTIISLEKKLKDNNSRAAGFDGVKPSSKTNNPYGTKEIANLKEKIRLLEGQIKLKEAALQASTNSFLKKEKDLQNQIEELAERLKMLNQNEESFCECKCGKVHTDGIANSTEIEEGRDAAQCIVRKASSCTCPCSNAVVLDKGPKASTPNTRDLDALSNEVALLKEQNKSMEEELKEMQERYSGISLKFAEVEGERQQLVMKLRNVKNAKKS